MKQEDVEEDYQVKTLGPRCCENAFFGVIIERFDCLLSRRLRNQQTLILTRCLNRLKERYASPSDRKKNHILVPPDA